ncbi:hypothetical protein [Psychrobacillus vulpis]|uniref:DUF3221 domain-containing protein n=1 Tax=Psychrobacillus vulpis TaxID=2325572 RepID=A0A544TFK8_9BACI|nr:hypothetical protein [Psychrobacillus vulpis]TQR16233.1 hypothetical protein FG384_18975 [Psychrobacillus vulpis]
MKRILSLSVTVLLLIILSACKGTSGDSIKPNNENMIINIENNANFDIYGVKVNILGHSPTSVNADGSEIKKGQSLMFEFLEEDFKLDGEATMVVSILNNNNIENNDDVIPIDKKIKLELGNNKELFFEITGNSISKADLKKVN